MKRYLVLIPLLLTTLACNLSRMLDATPELPELSTPEVGATEAPSEAAEEDSPLDIAIPADRDILIDLLAEYDVIVGGAEDDDPVQLGVIYQAVYAHSLIAAEIHPEAATPQLAFQTMFGPTTIYLYPERDTVNALHYSVHCGWQGGQANTCQMEWAYPEQEFPAGRWVILFAGQPLLRANDYEGGVDLATHEFVHNLTYGGGHRPHDGFGYNYPHYTSVDIALDHKQAIGVQVGLYAYLDEPTRDAHLWWRRELTADALASLALGKLTGPHAESVEGYIREFLVCKRDNLPDCTLNQ